MWIRHRSWEARTKALEDHELGRALISYRHHLGFFPRFRWAGCRLLEFLGSVAWVLPAGVAILGWIASVHTSDIMLMCGLVPFAGFGSLWGSGAFDTGRPWARAL